MTITESASETITDAQWEIAHAIALTLVKDDTDVNEVRKAVAYLRGYIHQPDATSRFFKYLKTLVSNGRQIGHSGKTTHYYRSIDKACSDYLKSINDAHTILQILGWVSRLMRYYKDAGVPIGEIAIPTAPPPESARQAEVAKASSSQKFTVGQVIEAIIAVKKNIDVTYEVVFTKQRLSKKEHKKAQDLTEGQKVKVEILELKEDGSIKKVKLVD
ncbi:hypothetical protein ACQFX9_16345 [Aliinostoc sp. HNIBRCY26]|uniref:hypothetical protein n=1 Tax=Aliinostoc sp. HNIBRCY26 TaxID=3418997 RepID=UPI003D069074